LPLVTASLFLGLLQVELRHLSRQKVGR